MSLVFPAGKGRQITWLDRLNGKEEEEVKGQTKTASTKKKAAKVADKQELIGTAAISMNELKRLAQLSDFPQEDVQVEDALAAPVGEEPVAPEGEVEISDEAEGGEAEGGEEEGGAADVAEDAAEAGDPVEQAADAVADAQDALADAASALADAGADEGGAPTDSPIGEETSLDEEIEIPIEIDGEGEIGIGGECCGGDAAGDTAAGDPDSASAFPADDSKMASSKKGGKKQATAAVEDSTRFVKIAKLSPVNRQKLATYWVKTLGYDKDWVGQMLQDYN